MQAPDEAPRRPPILLSSDNGMVFIGDFPYRISDLTASWTAEETDETCCAFGVAGQFGIEFIPGETWR